MIPLKHIALAAILGAAFYTAPVATAATASGVPLPPLKVRTQTTGGVPAGEWAAKAGALDFAKTKQLAEDAEKAGDTAKALTCWERVLDRTTCTEADRVAARARVKELRPKVRANTDPAKARPWRVLALVYEEVKAEKTAPDGKTTQYHQIMNADDKAVIGRALGGFRDLVFEYSSGVLLPQIDVVVIKEPVKKIPDSKSDFLVGYRAAAAEFRKARDAGGKKYDTVITYVKYRGKKGPNVPRPPYIAAAYGSIGELDGAGYIIIPWGTHFPIPNEEEGEAELHEWLHQIDDVVHKNLGYPRGTTRSSDDGQRDPDYTRPPSAKSWAHFYRHLMAEHMTRQVWNEVTISRKLKPKPGAVIKTIKD
ncbi:MAG: hypothetical protein LBD14_02390 [Puniceicoccales bacterium]|jgi:hypothetical protein|nr:hypothetical protein [Puniceicoccales bacterium]